MTPLFLASGGILDQLGIKPAVLGTQVVIFVITFLVLSRTLFGRVLTHMQRREEEIRSSQETLERDRAEISRLVKEYEAEIAKIDREAYEKAQALIKEGLAAAAATVAAAQAKARDEVDRAHAETAREKREALSRLREEVTKLTLSVAEKVLEMPMDPVKHGAIVRQFVSERS